MTIGIGGIGGGGGGGSAVAAGAVADGLGMVAAGDAGLTAETLATGGGGSSGGARGNVLNRVGHQQDKWKRQVREQRKNIYDRHTMLN